MKAFTHVKLLTHGLLTAGLLLTGWPTSRAQAPDTTPTVATTNATEPTLRATVATYRDDLRQTVLLASTQPQVLATLAQQRTASQQAFQNLIQNYGQTKQGWFYDLSRYPDLVHTLATMPERQDRQSVDALTKGLPTDMQESAWKVYRHHHDDLVQVDNLMQQDQQAFNQLIAPLDVSTQQAFRQLIATPDVLTELTDHVAETKQLGEAYQANPDQVVADLTAEHARVTAQNQQELTAYQQELGQDPQAKQELQQAGMDYAKANGYRTGINPDPGWPATSSYAYANPYPFWFGYPYWFGSPVWYPSAWWLGTGFYYGPYGSLAFYGLPSFGFTNWFYTSGRYVYPHLYNRFNTYYVGNMAGRHVLTPGNAGFMTAAHRSIGSVNGFGGAQAGWLTRSGQFNRLNSPANARIGATRSFSSPNFGGYRALSFGGGMRSFGGRSAGPGSFGGGMRSFGGGFHGGRR